MAITTYNLGSGATLSLAAALSSKLTELGYTNTITYTSSTISVSITINGTAYSFNTATGANTSYDVILTVDTSTNFICVGTTNIPASGNVYIYYSIWFVICNAKYIDGTESMQYFASTASAYYYYNFNISNVTVYASGIILYRLVYQNKYTTADKDTYIGTYGIGAGNSLSINGHTYLCLGGFLYIKTA